MARYAPATPDLGTSATTGVRRAYGAAATRTGGMAQGRATRPAAARDPRSGPDPRTDPVRPSTAPCRAAAATSRPAQRPGATQAGGPALRPGAAPDLSDAGMVAAMRAERLLAL